MTLLNTTIAAAAAGVALATSAFAQSARDIRGPKALVASRTRRRQSSSLIHRFPNSSP